MPDRHSRLAEALISASQAEWRAYTEHPFVAQLGAGTLPKAAFLHYLRQWRLVHNAYRQANSYAHIVHRW